MSIIKCRKGFSPLNGRRFTGALSLHNSNVPGLFFLGLVLHLIFREVPMKAVELVQRQRVQQAL